MKDPKTRMVQAWEIMRLSDPNRCFDCSVRGLTGRTSSFLAGTVLAQRMTLRYIPQGFLNQVYLLDSLEEDYIYHIVKEVHKRQT
jgi:hypothetical protein